MRGAGRGTGDLRRRSLRRCTRAYGGAGRRARNCAAPLAPRRSYRGVDSQCRALECASREGKLYDPSFNTRMRGTGHRAELLAGRFDYQPHGILDATHLRWITENTLRGVFACAALEIEDLRMSAGTTLQVYRERRPWRWLPRKQRRRVVRWAARRAPHWFGCQFIVSSRPVPAIGLGAPPRRA